MPTRPAAHARAVLTDSASTADVASGIGWERGSILAAATLWGTTGTAATFAPHGTSPLAVGAAAMGLGGLLLLVTAGRSAPRLIRARATRSALLIGAGCVAIYPLAFYSSMAKAGVAVGVTLTIGSSPVFAALIERTLDQPRLSARWATATAVAVIGACLLGSSGVDPGPGHRGAAVGVLLALIAGFCYAGYSVAAARLLRGGAQARAAMGSMFGLGAVVLVPTLALTGLALIASTRGILVAGYLAAIPVGLAYVLFGFGLRHTAASIATALSLIEPLVAAVLAEVVAHQHLLIAGWVGIVLVAASVTAIAAEPTAAEDTPQTTTQQDLD